MSCLPDSQTELKPYSSPRLNKLTPEQAKLLLGQATQGDQGAKDLQDVIFPDPEERWATSFPMSWGKGREVS